MAWNNIQACAGAITVSTPSTLYFATKSPQHLYTSITHLYNVTVECITQIADA